MQSVKRSGVPFEKTNRKFALIKHESHKRTICMVLAGFLLAGCAPEVQPPVRVEPREVVERPQLSRLTSDLGSPDKIRAQMGAVALVLGVASNVLIQNPTAAKDPAGLLITEKALIGQQQRLNAVALSKADDELMQTVAELCTPDALGDAQSSGSLLSGVAAVNPPKRVANDEDKLANFKRNQRIYEQSALYLIQIETRCSRNNAAAPPASSQAQAQAQTQVAAPIQEEDAALNTPVLQALLAAQISAPQVDAIDKQN